MQTHAKTITHSTLRSLVAAGAALGAEVVGAAGGWGIVINYGRASQTLTVQRGEQPRTFRRFETVAAYLKELGITDMRVHTAQFEPVAVDKPSDKRGELASARMKSAHEAAVHDKWFRDQVGRALAEASAPDAEPSISHAQAKVRMAAQRAALQARVGKAS